MDTRRSSTEQPVLLFGKMDIAPSFPAHVGLSAVRPGWLFSIIASSFLNNGNNVPRAFDVAAVRLVYFYSTRVYPRPAVATSSVLIVEYAFISKNFVSPAAIMLESLHD